MKKLLICLLLLATTVTSAHAGIKVIGNGDVMHLDPSSLPPLMRANYEIFRIKCTQCHSQERAIVAIQTGMAPISGGPFDSAAIKAYGVKMLRTSDMSKADIKKSVELLNFLLAEKDH